MVTLVAAMAVLLGLAAVSTPVAARYLPTKRGLDNDRLDRLAHLIKEVSDMGIGVGVGVGVALDACLKVLLSPVQHSRHSHMECQPQGFQRGLSALSITQTEMKILILDIGIL